MKAEEVILKVKDMISYIIDDDIRIYHKYMSQLKPNSFVIDLATGWGKSVVAMALSNPNVIIFTIDNGDQPKVNNWAKDLVDYKTKINDEFKKHNVWNVLFKIGDFLTDKVPFEKYDLISFDTPIPHEKTVLKRWLRSLKPGGIALVRNYKRFKEEADDVLKGYEYLELGGLIQVVKKPL